MSTHKTRFISHNGYRDQEGAHVARCIIRESVGTTNGEAPPVLHLWGGIRRFEQRYAPVIPRSHVASRGHEINVEVKVLIFLKVRGFEVQS